MCNVRFIYGFDLWPWHCDLDLGNFVQPCVWLLLMLASSACTCLFMVAHRCAMSRLFMDLTFQLATVTLTLAIFSILLCGFYGLFVNLTFDLDAATFTMEIFHCRGTWESTIIFSFYFHTFCLFDTVNFILIVSLCYLCYYCLLFSSVVRHNHKKNKNIHNIKQWVVRWHTLCETSPFSISNGDMIP